MTRGGLGRMNRRAALKALTVSLAVAPLRAAGDVVSTLIGTGSPGYSDPQVNNPYGLVIGPDGALYFCDLDNQRIRRLDLRDAPDDDRRRQRREGYARRRRPGDGGVAEHAARDPVRRAGHLYIAERDNHVIRKVDAKTGVISTSRAPGAPDSPATADRPIKAQLRQPHSIAFDPRRNRLLICDIGNQRIRASISPPASSRPSAAPASGSRRPTARRSPARR